MNLKNRIHHFVEKGSHGSGINLAFDYGIMALIILNVLAMMLETVPQINEVAGTWLDAFEVFSVIVFTIEYILRIYISSVSHPASSHFRSALIFIFSAYGIIDLLAILPFYLPFVIPFDLRFVRIMRLLRLLRVLKISRYNNSLHLIYQVIREKRAELAITFVAIVLILIIASFLMYYIEGDVQPSKFSDIFSSFWWAVVTLTTLGYGDVVPVTTLGKIISGIIAILGIGLVALPAGLLSAGFIEKIRDRREGRKTCPHCGKEI